MKLYAMVAVTGKNFCICDEKSAGFVIELKNTPESASKPMVAPEVKILNLVFAAQNLIQVLR